MRYISPYVASPRWPPSVLALLSIWLGLVAVDPCAGQELEDADWRSSNDPVAKLWRRLDAGETRLDTTTEKAFLTSLLKELDIPVESQVLVFSKTSLQKEFISPWTPRAIYFNEECYIGWVQGGDLEVVASDPGAGFQYYLVHRPTQPAERPRLATSGQCLTCHTGGDLQIQSVFTRPSGYPFGRVDRYVTTYESPLSERWGGWYVTGTHGAELHMGNVTVDDASHGVTLKREKGANLTSLEGLFPIQPYPAPTSDLVALMVLEHQYVMHNALQDAARAHQRLQEREQSGTTSDPTVMEGILARRAEKLVSLLLFSGEYPLQGGGVTGSPTFQKAFQRNKRSTPAGASLKDFHLRTRLFQHRCSYMIHSASFKALPAPLKSRVYARLHEILTGKDQSAPYAHLDAEERRAIRAILQQTEPEIRDAWSASPAPATPAPGQK